MVRMISDLSVNATAAKYVQQGNRSRTESAATTAGTVPAADNSPADELDLSIEAKLFGLFGTAPRDDGMIHIEDVRTDNRQRAAALQGNLGALLDKAGVDRSQEALLQVDAMGRVVVANDHPDKEKIEAIFANDPDLANSFRQVSATSEFLQAADEAVGFQAAYAKDPRAAVEQYSYLFDDNRDGPRYNLRITADAIEPLFSAE